MEAWIANPELMVADADAEYAEIIEIDLADLKEPVLCAPNDPDDARLLSSVAGEKIDEVFIGSCMTNIGHFRAAAKLLEGKRDIPTKEEYMADIGVLDASSKDIYRYMNFDQIEDYQDVANTVAA